MYGASAGGVASPLAVVARCVDSARELLAHGRLQPVEREGLEQVAVGTQARAEVGGRGPGGAGHEEHLHGAQRLRAADVVEDGIPKFENMVGKPIPELTRGEASEWIGRLSGRAA